MNFIPMLFSSYSSISSIKLDWYGNDENTSVKAANIQYKDEDMVIEDKTPYNKCHLIVFLLN